MTRAITLRLDDDDHRALQRQAAELRVRPGTLARILVHAGLTAQSTTAETQRSLAALDRLVRRSHSQPPADAVALVDEARRALDPGQ